MSDPALSVEDLAMRVADGLPVDWDEALRSSSSDAERRVVQQLQLMQSVARVHGSTGPESPAARAAAPIADERPAHDLVLGTWGHLELREKLSEGSYGELYRAWDRHLDREVALKLLKLPPASPANPPASAIVEEGRLLAKLHHPNVVTVFGAHAHDGRIGLWMELIKGRSLEELLQSHGLMGAREATVIGIDMCRALAAVHGTGIIHRDVKAQNVMREQGGRIVLMDFGAGIEPRPDQAHTGAKITGTPFYMAPELLRGEAATQQSDIYSLGVLLYRLVTGRFPVEASSWDELTQRHGRGEAALLRDARADLPAGFVAAVERATAADPLRRFATAGHMEQALSQWAGAAHGTSESPTVARTESSIVVRRVLLGAMAVVAVGAAAALMYSNRSKRESPILPPTSSQATGAAIDPTSAPSQVSGGAIDPIPAKPVSYTVQAAVYRVAAGSTVRERLEPGARLALGDRLTLEFEASRALYVYVVNEDEAGHAYALFPLTGLDELNPLGPGSVHVLPGSRAGKPLSWTVDSPGGREHLLVLASPARLEEYEAEMSTLAQPGQTAIALPEAARIRLRGLGSLSESPAASGTRSASRLFEMAQRLASESETVSGVWMRRIELENPRP